MAIELIRQFYDTKRTFRITGEGGNPQFVEMDNANLQPGQQFIAGQEFVTKAPIFDVEPIAQKQNPYTTLSQNQLAMEFYDRGFFNPQLAEQALQCIEMMDFQGKEKIRQGIQKNSMLYQQLQQMQQALQLSAQALADHGDPRVLQALGGINDNNQDQEGNRSAQNRDINARTRGLEAGQ
jgi:hypothetical protein